MRSVLPWLVTLVALIVMVVVIVQRPVPPPLTHPAEMPAEAPADSAALAKVKELIGKNGEWSPEDADAFREAYFKLPTNDRLEQGQALARAVNSGVVKHPKKGGPVFSPLAPGAEPVTPCSPPTCPTKEGSGPARGTPAMPKGTTGK
jgi:hypothetical protein